MQSESRLLHCLTDPSRGEEYQSCNSLKVLSVRGPSTVHDHGVSIKNFSSMPPTWANSQYGSLSGESRTTENMMGYMRRVKGRSGKGLEITCVYAVHHGLEHAVADVGDGDGGGLLLPVAAIKHGLEGVRRGQQRDAVRVELLALHQEGHVRHDLAVDVFGPQVHAAASLGGGGP